MNLLWKVSSFLLVVLSISVTYLLNSKPDYPVPVIAGDDYFGAGDPSKDDETIEPFKISVSDDDIADCKARVKAGLQRYFPPREDIRFWDGFNPDQLKPLADAWMRYDWKQHQNHLNHFTHFKTQIEGLRIHFIRACVPDRSSYRRIVPLLMVHGWPGSVYEFHKVLPLLTNPARFGLSYGSGGRNDLAFEVITPSLPGFAWSEAAVKPGMSYIATARIFNKLMVRLGFEEYYVQGGDWGSVVVAAMAALYPQRVKGLHLNMPHINSVMFPGTLAKHLIGSYFPSLVVDQEDLGRFLPLKQHFLSILKETGYYLVQATKPNTIGIALNDSPLGLAGWILEKFSTASNVAFLNETDGGLTRHFTMDELLTDVMIYWVTQSAGTAARFYKEANQDEFHSAMQKASVHVATALAYFPHEPLSTPKAFLEYKYKNIIQCTRLPRGGHFAALQEPNIFAQDVFEFVEKIEH